MSDFDQEHAQYLRRQRAQDAAYTWGVDGVLDPTVDVESAIETAIRVRVDKDVCIEAWRAHEARTGPMEGPDDPEFVAMLCTAFAAAGFEVEE
jgi:hypothetical protein